MALWLKKQQNKTSHILYYTASDDDHSPINIVLHASPKILKTTISVDSHLVFVSLMGQILLESFGG